MRNKTYLLFVFFLCSCQETPSILIDKNLKEVASFPIGLAVSANKFGDSRYAEIISQEFNSMTAEREMKQNILMPEPNIYNWIYADSIIAFAQRHQMRVHGHTLLWHSATSYWLEIFQGTDAEFEAVIKDYIQTVVARYAGKVASWDVVNEAFEDEGGVLRQSLFQRRIGDDYVAKCFQWAREADPDVLLFYNDYGLVWNESKCEAVLEMLDNFEENNIPIDGIGLQMHISTEYPKNRTIEKAVDLFVKRGLKIHFSEIDIRVNTNGNAETFTQDLAEEQFRKVKAITEIYNKIPSDQQAGMTLWGLRDNQSWVLGHWGNVDWPLFFDEKYDRKLAHQGFLQAL